MEPVTLTRLQKHVLVSNFFERIVALPGDPLYDQHLAAAKRAAQGGLLYPNVLHRILMKGVLPSNGRYRRLGVTVAGSVCPDWQRVPELMVRWWNTVCKAIARREEFNEKEKIALAFSLHDWLLCIHPYEDGNGRTARLMLNVIRRELGLSWHIIHPDRRGEYMARIQIFEEDFFGRLPICSLPEEDS